MSLSAIVITKNEEANIGRCLTSLAFADEIIVVDAESTDRTLDIAKEHGARVFVRPWPGYGMQKNFAAEQAHGDWLLFIDADEEVTPQLQQEIKNMLANPQVDFYWLRIVTIFLGKPLHHLYGHNPRLFKKTAGKWTESPVHEQVERYGHSDTAQFEVIRLDDRFSKILSAPLLHHSHQTIASYLQKMHTYTTLDATYMSETNRHRSGRPVRQRWTLPWYLAARQFVKLLVYRRGILDGWAGIVWCTLSAYYEWEMAKKFNSKIKGPV